jgi:hypothetical protein
MKIITTPRSQPWAHAPLFALARANVAMLALILCGLFVSGCGNTLYLVKVNEAEEDLHEAQEIGAEQYAPYEYYSAEARLKEAKKQAAQAEYGNASQLSNEASTYAEAAIRKSKKVRDARGAPPQRTRAVQ